MGVHNMLETGSAKPPSASWRVAEQLGAAATTYTFPLFTSPETRNLQRKLVSD